MKKIKTYSTIAILATLLSCNKDRNLAAPESGNDRKASLLSKLSPFKSADEEVARIVADIDNPRYTVAIIDNPNFGSFSRTPGSDIVMSGASPADVSVILNGKVFRPDAQGQWLRQDGSLKDYYGKNVSMRVDYGSVKGETYTVYVPKPALAAKLGAPNSQEINRTGNILRWTPDPANDTEVVALVYELYADDQDGGEQVMYHSDILLLNNTGQFKLDEILADPKCKKIYFRLVTGNTTSVWLDDESKLLFHISSYDHHEYLIKD